MLNRLWVRLSIAFFAAVFLGSILPLILLRVMLTSGIFEPQLNSAEPEVTELVFGDGRFVFYLQVDVLAWMQDSGFFEFIVSGRTLFLIAVVLSLMVGGLIGVAVSRGISKPLSDLVTATRAVGGSNLSYRAKMQGSDEMRDLAAAFNSMTGSLEASETVRQNMMADVAHELRTPLSVLDGNLRAMLDGIFPTTTEKLGLLYEQTTHLTKLVNDLQLLSLAEARELDLDLTPFDLGKLIAETAATFQGVGAEQGVAVSAETPPNLTLVADQSRIRQVLHNLLANAIRHTPANGGVHVSARRIDGQIELVVRDSGEGIEAEKLAVIFNRFERGSAEKRRDNGGSIGLGLAISKALIELHNGTIYAASAGKNQGSTFTIALPASTKQD